MADRRARRRPGHGRRGADLLDVRDGCARRQRASRSTSQHVPQRETGMTPYEIMLSESQERMLLVVKRGREAEVERDLRQVGSPRRHASATSPSDGAAAGEEPAATSSPRSRTRALVDEAPVYDRPTARPAYLDEVRPARLAVASTAPRRREAFSTLLASPTHREQAVGLSAVRPHGAHQHAGARRHGRRRRARQGHAAGARDVHRRQRPLLLSRSAPGRDAGGGRSGAQRRVRRRRADRRHELPELRQPRAAGDHVAVRRGGRGHRRGLPGAGHPDHRRQRQPLQRDRWPGDLSDAGHRRRRRDRGRVARRSSRTFRQAGRRRSCCWARPRRARRQRVPEDACTASCAGEPPRSTSAANVRCIELLARPPAGGLLSRRTTAPTAASPSRSRNAPSTPAGIGLDVDVPAARGSPAAIVPPRRSSANPRRASSSR